MPKFGLDCRNCTEIQKKERGCTKNSLIPNAWEIESLNWKFSRCPKKLVTQQSRRYIRAYNFYKESNSWPNPGTWQYQPIKFLEVIELIDEIVVSMAKKK